MWNNKPDVISSHIQFMQACEQTTASFHMGQIELYMKLCIEETEETVNALAKIQKAISESKPIHRNDVAELADGAGDMIITAIGLLASIGVDAKGVMEEICKSNAAKVHPDGKVHKRGDGKVQKPEAWQPPNLLPFVDEVLGT